MLIHTKIVYQYNPDTEEMELIEDEFYEYSGPVAQAGGGGGGDTKTIAQPPKFQIPFIEQTLQEAQKLYESGGLSTSPYPGATVAPLNPDIAASLDATRQAAGNTGAIANLGANQLALGFQNVDPTQSPYFANAVEGAIRPATQALTEQALPAIQDQFIASGQFGGSRQGVAEGLALDRYQQNVLDTVAQMGQQAYTQGQQQQARLLGLTPSVQALQQTPGALLGKVGEAQRSYEQQFIDAAIQRYMQEQAQQYEALQRYSGLVGNPLGQQTIQENEGPGKLASALGYGATGAALGASIPGLGAGAGAGLAALGPAGIALGAAGALYGLYSG